MPERDTFYSVFLFYCLPMLGTTALDLEGLASHSNMLLFIIGSKSREGSMWSAMAKPPCRCKEESEVHRKVVSLSVVPEKRAPYSLCIIGAEILELSKNSASQTLPPGPE